MLSLIYFRLFYNTTDHCTTYTSTSVSTFPISTLTVRLLLRLSVHLPLHLFILSQILQYAYFYFFLSIYFYTYSFYPNFYSTPASTLFCPSTFTHIFSIPTLPVRLLLLLSVHLPLHLFSAFLSQPIKRKTFHLFFRYEKFRS